MLELTMVGTKFNYFRIELSPEIVIDTNKNKSIMWLWGEQQY